MGFLVAVKNTDRPLLILGVLCKILSKGSEIMPSPVSLNPSLCNKSSWSFFFKAFEKYVVGATSHNHFLIDRNIVNALTDISNPEDILNNSCFKHYLECNQRMLKTNVITTINIDKEKKDTITTLYNQKECPQSLKNWIKAKFPECIENDVSGTIVTVTNGNVQHNSPNLTHVRDAGRSMQDLPVQNQEGPVDTLTTDQLAPESKFQASPANSSVSSSHTKHVDGVQIDGLQEETRNSVGSNCDLNSHGQAHGSHDSIPGLQASESSGQSTTRFGFNDDSSGSDGERRVTLSPLQGE